MLSQQTDLPVALLYQAVVAPPVDGVQKPPKPGGYRDSGADIAFNLRAAGLPVVTPNGDPNPARDLDWVFPDTEAGIAQALALGARVLWANTVLFVGHPLDRPLLPGIRVVGQTPAQVQRHDDKWFTNELLRRHGCPVPPAILVGTGSDPHTLQLGSLSEEGLAQHGLSLPVVVKPVRGRGSQGVRVVTSLPELRESLQETFNPADGTGPKYGSRMIVEQFLPGRELTVTVMPPGVYSFDGVKREFPTPWCLPPVRRFHHQQGIAPYSGVTAVVHNSAVLTEAERADPAVVELEAHCTRAAQLVRAVAPIRIDARGSVSGRLYLFDLNMKPNLTGPGRPGRDEQDCLVSLAARGVGWTYPDLLIQILRQAWEPAQIG